MSVKSAPYYWLICDEPGCGAKSTEGQDYSAWEDESQAVESADCSDWLILPDGKHYCDQHANKHDPDLKEDCNGSATCDSLGHVEGCFATNPDFAPEATP
jgi:hypothetical protein